MPIYYRIRFKYGKRQGKLFIYASDLATYQNKESASEGDHYNFKKKLDQIGTFAVPKLYPLEKEQGKQYIVIELGPSKYITIRWGLDGLTAERLDKLKDEERYIETGKTARVGKVIDAATFVTFKETDPWRSKLTSESFVRLVMLQVEKDS